MRYVKKHGSSRQATYVNLTRRMRFTCRKTKAKLQTRFQYLISFFFHDNGYANASHCYVLRTLPVSSYSLSAV